MVEFSIHLYTMRALSRRPELLIRFRVPTTSSRQLDHFFKIWPASQVGLLVFFHPLLYVAARVFEDLDGLCPSMIDHDIFHAISQK